MANFLFLSGGLGGSGFKMARGGVILGRSGNKLALAHRRCNTIETDLNALRTLNKIFGILGCDGSFRSHLGGNSTALFSRFPSVIFLN